MCRFHQFSSFETPSDAYCIELNARGGPKTLSTCRSDTSGAPPETSAAPPASLLRSVAALPPSIFHRRLADLPAAGSCVRCDIALDRVGAEPMPAQCQARERQKHRSEEHT